MTTPFLPTKAQLLAATFSPSQVVLDGIVENFLIQTNAYSFIGQLSTAFRSGQSQTYPAATLGLGSSLTTSATSFIYISDATTIGLLINYLTNAIYGYNYTVSTWTAGSPGSWTSVTSGSGTAISGGVNDRKQFILVAWA